ncbi:MAG TPA: Ku protein [Actinomycetota bacterium]|nr:Ku protein [Actinomycetota bacterium]
MARSVWTGTLGFGLVSIPVSLIPATEPKDVRFHLFDRRGRRVRYRRVVEETSPLAEPTEGDEVADEPAEHPLAEPPGPDGDETDPERAGRPPEREVAYEDLVRGVEVEPDAFVFLEREDIDRARPTPSRTIDLERFVELEEIDPVFFEKAYYVVPAFGAERPYALLLRALEETGRIGIGRFVLRTKPHLVAIRPMGGAIGLETLYFGDEIRDVPGRVRDAGDVAVGGRELNVATQLVEALAGEWEPSAFADGYREELLRIIAERTPERVEEPAERLPARGRIDDLMDALRRSVDEAKAGRRRGSRAG